MSEHMTLGLRDALLKAAEDKVRDVLIWLDDELIDTGFKVDSIECDTRNFASMAVEIKTVARRPLTATENAAYIADCNERLAEMNTRPRETGDVG
jgi:hypothetical protein